jgi:hypothetical protein
LRPYGDPIRQAARGDAAQMRRLVGVTRRWLAQNERQVETIDGRELPPGTFAELGPPRSGGDPARRLAVCRGCRCHVFAGTLRCPHCGGDRRALARAAYSELAALMTEV